MHVGQFCRAYGLLHENVNNGLLKTCAQVGECSVSRWRPVVPQVIQDRGLYPAKTEVQALGIKERSRESDCERIPPRRKGIYTRPAGIPETEHFRHFVERFPRRIVSRLSEYLLSELSLNVHKHGMTPRDNQREEGICRRWIMEQYGVQMPFHVIDTDERDTKPVCKGLAKIQSYKKSTDKTRTERRRDRVNIVLQAPGAIKSFLYYLGNKPLVSPRSQFGHNTTVFPMHILRRNHVRNDPAVPHDRRRSFVTRCFYPENNHSMHCTERGKDIQENGRKTLLLLTRLVIFI